MLEDNYNISLSFHTQLTIFFFFLHHKQCLIKLISHLLMHSLINDFFFLFLNFLHLSSEHLPFPFWQAVASILTMFLSLIKKEIKSKSFLFPQQTSKQFQNCLNQDIVAWMQRIILGRRHCTLLALKEMKTLLDTFYKQKLLLMYAMKNALHHFR